MKEKLKVIKNNNGVTLTELLVALTLICIITMCFMPLFASYYRNMTTAGNIVAHNYDQASIIEKLLSNSGSNKGYEFPVDELPLTLSLDGEKSLTTNDSDLGLDDISGNAIYSDGNNFANGYNTFYADSISASMYCYPSHISDDFLEKTITIIASGFKFNDASEFNLYYTGSTGTLSVIPNYSTYYTVKIDREDASIAYLTLIGNNGIINFEHSPLVVTYGKHILSIEIDAPTMIMIGEDMNNGYYFVTDGTVDSDGNLTIIKKKMDNVLSSTAVSNSTMNDVEWIPANEGDGANVDANGNSYGYYVMCGDNGQIRRFWKNVATGNYYWGGDTTYQYDYSNINGIENITSSQVINGTTASSSFIFRSDPGVTGTNTSGLLLDNGAGGLHQLYSNNIFTVNKVEDSSIWRIANINWLSYNNEHTGNSSAGNMFTNYPETYSGLPSSATNQIYPGLGVSKLNASDLQQYNDYIGNSGNAVTLTSVDAIRMSSPYSYSDKNYPTSSYMLYCGYVPAVMDIWSPSLTLGENNANLYTRLLGTLGVAYTNSDNVFNTYRKSISSSYTSWWQTKWNLLDSNIWAYGNIPAGDYSISGVCAPTNYATLQATADAVASSGNTSSTKTVLPLGLAFGEAQLQTQNSTNISIGYLSNPNALAKTEITESGYDLSSDRSSHGGAYQWTFDDGTTLLDADSFTLDDGNTVKNFSIAVGYTLSGIEYSLDGSVICPTIMNNGIVYLRSGGANNETEGTGYEFNSESNIFHQFYYTNSYWRYRNTETLGGKNTLNLAVSAGYWRDCYHPLFYSVYGTKYDASSDDNKYNFVMSHILQDKKINTVKWGTTWNQSPEAMWGASDGTLMSWDVDMEAMAGSSGYKIGDYNDESVMAEFQSYKSVDENANKKYNSRYINAIGIGSAETYVLPSGNTAKQILDNMTTDYVSKYSDKDRRDENVWYDRWSVELNKTDTMGFISSLDSVEDVEFANDIWVACGIQGQTYPSYCRSSAVVGTNNGSWINVCSWYQQNEDSIYPNANDNAYHWQAVKISNIIDCNIQQVNYVAGKWFATGYIDKNDNDKYDDGEKAVVFYATDPTKSCGQTDGWRLSKSGTKNYTQAYENVNGKYELVDIGAINSVACRDD